jgi:hypothetical protein
MRRSVVNEIAKMAVFWDVAPYSLVVRGASCPQKPAFNCSKIRRTVQELTDVYRHIIVLTYFYKLHKNVENYNYRNL